MSEVFLGLIALGVLVMALIQVAAIVFAARAARRMGDAVSRLEQDVRPLVAKLQTISAEAGPVIASLQTIVAETRPIMDNLKTMASDAARATSVAAAQIDRAERVMTDFLKRVDGTISSLQATLLKPARQGLAVVHGIRAAFDVLRERRPGDRPPMDPGPRKRGVTVEEEDALFIG